MRNENLTSNPSAVGEIVSELELAYIPSAAASVVLEADLLALLKSKSQILPYFSSFLNLVPAFISVVDTQGNILFANAFHETISDLNYAAEPPKLFEQLFPNFSLKQFKPSILDAIKSGGLTTWDLNATNKHGELNHYRICHQIICDSDAEQNLILTIGVKKNSSRNQSADYEKAHASFENLHDPLTGLANRSLFYDRLQKSISRGKRGNSNIAVLLLDLDRFKNINDSLGHDAGDYYLKKTSERMVRCLRTTDTVARLGGDEFIVLLDSIINAHDIEYISTKLLDSISQPINISGHDIRCTASIGVSLYPKDGDTVDQLLKRADVAMSSAKSLQLKKPQFYAKAMTENAVNYLLIENDLRRAIFSGDLVLHYQPQVNLKNKAIIGVEALVRWQHKERGLISPLEFIPLAEETGLIEPLGDWVLQHACHRFKCWLDMGINFGKIAVNLSPRQFRQEQFENRVVAALNKSKLKASNLEFEITESSAMENPAETIQVMQSMSRMGLSLAIDDFGTGYSSLSYLKRFPINKLKIDRSFIDDIDQDDADAAIAKSVIDLAHNMSLEVLAEGVERNEQSRWLNRRGCDQVQGYFFSKPLSEENLMLLVKDESKSKVVAETVFLV